MKTINISNTNETLYYEKLDNGLEIYIVPNNNQKNFYITFNTRFGSNNTEFKTNNEIVVENKTTKQSVSYIVEYSTVYDCFTFKKSGLSDEHPEIICYCYEHDDSVIMLNWLKEQFTVYTNITESGYTVSYDDKGNFTIKK